MRLPKGELADDPKILKPYILELEARIAELEAGVAELLANDDPSSYSSMVYWREKCYEARAEVERLRADLDLQDKERERVVRGLQGRIGELSAEVERLRADSLSSAPPYYRFWQEAQAEVERLKEAGRRFDGLTAQRIKELEAEVSELTRRAVVAEAKLAKAVKLANEGMNSDSLHAIAALTKIAALAAAKEKP